MELSTAAPAANWELDFSWEWHLLFGGLFLDGSAKILTVLTLLLSLVLSVVLHFDTDFHREGVFDQQAFSSCVVSYFNCHPHRAIQLFGILFRRLIKSVRTENIPVTVS